MILTPANDPLFYNTLATPPPQRGSRNWEIQPQALVFEPGQLVGRPASASEVREYLYGGEYDERAGELGLDADQVSERF